MTFATGIAAALAAPLFEAVGFLEWDIHWRVGGGSAFALNLYKCNLAAFGFLVMVWYNFHSGGSGSYNVADFMGEFEGVGGGGGASNIRHFRNGNSNAVIGNALPYRDFEGVMMENHNLQSQQQKEGSMVYQPQVNRIHPERTYAISRSDDNNQNRILQGLPPPQQQKMQPQQQQHHSALPIQPQKAIPNGLPIVPHNFQTSSQDEELLRTAEKYELELYQGQELPPPPKQPQFQPFEQSQPKYQSHSQYQAQQQQQQQPIFHKRKYYMEVFTAKRVFPLVISSFLGIIIGDCAELEALRLVGARRVLALGTMRPFAAAVLGNILLGEDISFMAWVGMAMTVIGVLVVLIVNLERLGSGGLFWIIPKSMRRRYGSSSTMGSRKSSASFVSGRMRRNISRLSTCSSADSIVEDDSSVDESILGGSSVGLFMLAPSTSCSTSNEMLDRSDTPPSTAFASVWETNGVSFVTNSFLKSSSRNSLSKYNLLSDYEDVEGSSDDDSYVDVDSDFSDVDDFYYGDGDGDDDAHDDGDEEAGGVNYERKFKPSMLKSVQVVVTNMDQPRALSGGSINTWGSEEGSLGEEENEDGEEGKETETHKVDVVKEAKQQAYDGDIEIMQKSNNDNDKQEDYFIGHNDMSSTTNTSSLNNRHCSISPPKNDNIKKENNNKPLGNVSSSLSSSKSNSFTYPHHRPQAQPLRSALRRKSPLIGHHSSIMATFNPNQPPLSSNVEIIPEDSNTNNDLSPVTPPITSLFISAPAADGNTIPSQQHVTIKSSKSSYRNSSNKSIASNQSSCGPPPGYPQSETPHTRLSRIKRGYLLALLNVLLDSYGSILTKQSAIGMTTWEINLIRFGFAGFALFTISCVMRMLHFVSGKTEHVIKNKNKLHHSASDEVVHHHDKLLATTARPTSPEPLSAGGNIPDWFRLPNMKVRPWITVSLGVLFVTFLCPALQNYALFQISFALAITLTSVTPLFSLPLSYIMKGELPTRRGCLGATIAVLGVVVLCVWGTVG